MRKLPYVAGLLTLAGMALAGAAARAEGPAPAPVVLKAARVFTSTSERPLAPGMVIVEGDHITQVGQSLEVPAGARVIDLGDATLLPGFIDAHVHLSMELGSDWYRDFYSGHHALPRRAGALRRPVRPQDRSRPASPPCATWARRTSWRSGCATRSTPASPRGRAC